MAKKASGRAHRLDDKRNSGLGDNVKFTVSENDGQTKRLFSIFNERRQLGQGKRLY